MTLNNWKEEFDKEFNIGDDNRGIVFINYNDGIEREIPLKAVERFISSLLEEKDRELSQQ